MGQKVLYEMLPVVYAKAHEALNVDLMQSGFLSPDLDIRAMQHERLVYTTIYVINPVSAF